jgi:hypothetical protein
MATIRLAEPYDLSRLMQFDSFPGDRIAEIVEKRMLVAEIDSIVVGYVAWQHADAWAGTTSTSSSSMTTTDAVVSRGR